MNRRVMKASALFIPYPSSLIPCFSVSSRRLAAQGWVNRYLVEGRNQNAFGFGVSGGEQVELRNLARQNAELGAGARTGVGRDGPGGLRTVLGRGGLSPALFESPAVRVRAVGFGEGCGGEDYVGGLSRLGQEKLLHDEQVEARERVRAIF